MRLITLNLPERYIKGLDKLVSDKHYPSRAEAIRLAIRDMLQIELWKLPKQRPHTRIQRKV